MPDHSSPSGVLHSHTCPPQIYEKLLKAEWDYYPVAYFKTPELFPWVRRPVLDYPTVNPTIQIFAAKAKRN